MAKRTAQVNVRLTPEDLEIMQQAAAKVWPGVPITKSTLVLTLARRAAEDILKGKKPR